MNDATPDEIFAAMLVAASEGDDATLDELQAMIDGMDDEAGDPENAIGKLMQQGMRAGEWFDAEAVKQIVPKYYDSLIQSGHLEEQEYNGKQIVRLGR